jgi:hypothetical protein
MAKYRSSVMLAALVAAGAAGTALAGGGDNGMNPFYGDSWAALEGGGVNTSGDTAMPGADSVHAGMTAHGGWHAFDSTRHAGASPLWTDRAPAASDAQRAPALMSMRPAAQPAVHQIDPFEDKAGS